MPVVLVPLRTQQNPTQGENFDQHESLFSRRTDWLRLSLLGLNLTALNLDSVIICTQFYEVWIVSSCYVTVIIYIIVI